MTIKIALLQCPHGHTMRSGKKTALVRALAIDGYRITGVKCCGSWSTVHEFVVSEADLETALTRARLRKEADKEIAHG